jgi:uncharacterized protein
MRVPTSDGVVVRVRVQPRAARDEVVGWREQTLRIRVSAPPVDGRANEAVERLLARAAGVAPSAVRVVGGATGRDKLVRITGLTETALRARLPG